MRSLLRMPTTCRRRSLIVGLGHVVFLLLAEVAGAGATAGLWIGIFAGAECCGRDGIHKKKGRLRCRKRPKSREETPKEGSDSAKGATTHPS